MQAVTFKEYNKLVHKHTGLRHKLNQCLAFKAMCADISHFTLIA